MVFQKTLVLLLIVIGLFSCEDTEPQSETLSLVSISVDGSSLSDGDENIPIDKSITMSFSSVLDPDAFASLLTIRSLGEAKDLSISYTNSNSKANITLDFQYATSYNLSLASGVIGFNGEALDQAISISFTTQESDIITSIAPCTTPSQCLQSVELNGSIGSGTFEYYSNYPIYEEQAKWENLTQAVIVVHGASHNPDEYFSYLTNTLNSEELSESTVLIAPYFRNESTNSTDDFYWSGFGWRDGKLSNNSNKISSFEALDALISQLANKAYFPVLDRIVITGQSSGGRFTHTYAPSNKSQELAPEIAFNYIVSESQYFYYPDGQRINEATNQLYTPTNCASAEIWPFGFEVKPQYLLGVTEEVFNERFINRPITYLLGNGIGSDPTLNTNDCSATLLGSTRYQRGENMFQYMQLVYPSTNNHSKVIANGINHDGSAIYQSLAFRNYLKSLLN